jgi:CMP-2-keto-3-deoxyoctulosonic acid synthetase
MAEPRYAAAVVLAVPARLASTRLPGKVMACSDSAEVLDAVGCWGFEALVTSEQCSSGDDR